MKKDTLIFGNKKAIDRSNCMIGAGLTMIVVGTVTTILGERQFYKHTKAVISEDPKSSVINRMFEDLMTAINERA